MALDGSMNELGAALPALTGQQDQTTPTQQVMQAPAVPVPVVDNRSFTQKLLGGLLAGASGGAAAPLSSENGGILGLQAAQAADKNYKDSIALQNQQRTQQFQQQMQQQDQQNQNKQAVNADEMHGVQMHVANLSALKIAHEVEKLPEQDQLDYAERQKKMFDAYKGSGRETSIIPDTYDSLTQFMKQNPTLHPGNFEAIHMPGLNGKPGEVAIVRAPKPGDKPISSEKKASLLKSVGFDTKDLDLSGMKDEDFYKTFQQFGLKQIEEKAQMQRTQVTQAGEDRRNAATIAARTAGTDPNTPVTTADQAKIDALHAGTAITGDFTSGFGGAKEVQRLTNMWLNQHPDDAGKVNQFKAQSKQAQEVGVNQSLAAGRTLFQKNGSIDEIENLVKSIPRSEFPSINHYLQTGAYEGGNKHVAAVLSTLPDVQDLLAKFNTGSGSQTSDLRIKQAQSQLRQSDNAEQFVKSVDALRGLAVARYRGIVGKGDQENKFLTARYTPDSFGEGASSGSSNYQFTTKDGKQGWDGSKWIPIKKDK